MTDPQHGSTPGDGTTPPQQPFGYPPPSAPNFGYPPPMPPQYPGHGYPPPPGVYYDPAAPYGRDAITGEPLSDKSKVIAGLLQLIGLLGLLGFGRMYLGQVGLGIAQLLVGLACIFVISWLTCGVSLLVPAIWSVVDAVLIFTGNVRDPMGRPLRDGT